jgi:hypothetical protein
LPAGAHGRWCAGRTRPSRPGRRQTLRPRRQPPGPGWEWRQGPDVLPAGGRRPPRVRTRRVVRGRPSTSSSAFCGSWAFNAGRPGSADAAAERGAGARRMRMSCHGDIARHLPSTPACRRFPQRAWRSLWKTVGTSSQARAGAGAACVACLLRRLGRESLVARARRRIATDCRRSSRSIALRWRQLVAQAAIAGRKQHETRDMEAGALRQAAHFWCLLVRECDDGRAAGPSCAKPQGGERQLTPPSGRLRGRR